MTKTATEEKRIRTLQLGMSWLPEQAGNGLDRMYFGLVRHLPSVNVGVQGLVAGSPDVGPSSDHTVRAFASEAAILPRRLAALRKSVRRCLTRQSFDLVASHFALYTFPVLDLFRELPLVIHFHGPWSLESQTEGERGFIVRVKKTLEQAVYRRGARFIVLSEAFARVLQKEFDVPEAQIHIVPGGVDADRFDTGLSRQEARHRLGWPPDRPLLLSVRRLARRMGLENLIDAMRTVRKEVPEVLLYIAGKGPLADELNARIKAADLTRHVKLLGFVPEEDLPLAYCAADLSVVPTVALEGFGLITVESLAAGTPALVTPVGGLPDVVRDLSEALVFTSEKTSSLSNRLVAILKGQLSLPDSAACQSYARTRFDWPVIAEKTREVYEEVLS